MIKTENIQTYGMEAALRGMRNPMNSWAKADSYWTHIEDKETLQTADFAFFVGENDLGLMKRLCRAGPEHRKFLRQIFVSMDITAPLYWWKEFDQYKIGTVTDSYSTMHKIHSKEFTRDDFSHEHLTGRSLEWLDWTVSMLNENRLLFNESGNKEDWWQMIQTLPSSYNQRRTVTMNYEVALSMIRQRSDHKLDEWRKFCETLRDLPYLSELEACLCE